MPSRKLSKSDKKQIILTIIDHLFKPSAAITIIIVIIFLIMAASPTKSQSFFSTCQDAIKVLCGALAGAIAGEHSLRQEAEK